jgi:general secretion pathway protein I
MMRRQARLELCKFSVTSQRPLRSKRRSGLTLFEVLLSLAIFIAAMSAIGMLTVNGLRGAVRTRLQTEAVLRCQTKLTEVVAGVERVESVIRRPFPDDGRWFWTLSVDDSETRGLAKLKMTVSRMSDEKMGEISYTLLRLQRVAPGRSDGTNPGRMRSL